MTISVPTITALIDTNVVDITPIFDNTLYLIAYNVGTRYQHNGTLYENTIGTLDVPMYNIEDESTYAIGDIIYKDNFVQKVSPNIIPKDPSNYTIQSFGYNNTTWISRYATLFDAPTNFKNGNLFPEAITGAICISHTGEYLYMSSDNEYTIERFTLTSPFDISTAILVDSLDISAYTTVQSIKSINISPDGTLLTITQGAGSFNTNATETSVVKWDLSTPFSLVSAGGFLSVALPSPDSTYLPHTFTFSNDGSILITCVRGTVYTFPLSIPFDISSIGAVTSTTVFPDYMQYSDAGIQVSDDGLKLFIVDGAYYNRLMEFSLAVANSPSTYTLVGRKSLFSKVNACFIDYSGMYMYVQKDYELQQYYCQTAWDITSSAFDLFDRYYVTEVRDDGLIYTYGYTATYVDGNNTGVITQYNSVSSGTLDLSTRLFYTYYETADFYVQLLNDSVEESINIVTDGTYELWVGGTFVINDNGLYVRTANPISQEVEEVVGFNSTVVDSPNDLPNFSGVGATNDMKPFDSKNYTYASATGTMTYTITSESKFNVIALGNVKATSVTIVFKEEDGSVVTTINNTIDTSRDELGYLEDWHTTEIYYADTIISSGGTVEVTLNGTTIELATLLLGVAVDTGFTNLTMTHKYKDFSVFEYDEWGNADYTERAKVSTYTGSVDILIENYDRTDRLMTSLGKNLVMIDGSDSNNKVADSISIFAATKRIGRFLSFSQKTVIKDNDIDRMATYDFTLEEIV